MSSNNHVSIPISQQQHNSVVEPYSVQDNDFSSYNSYRDTDQEFSPGFKGRRLLGINNAVGKSRALFFKNLGLQRRQYKTICCQAAFPLLFVIIAGIVSLATGPPPLPVTSVGSNESSRGLYDSFSIQFHEYVDTIGGDQIFGNMSYSNYPSFVINSLEEDASKLGELTKEGDRSGFLGTLPQYTFLSQGQSVSLTPSFEPRSTWDNVSLDYYQMSLDHRQCQIEDDWERCRKIRNNLVVGGVEFKQLDIDNAHYDITVGTGKSKNVDYESPEYTQLWMINLFSDALLKLVSNEEFGIPFIAVQSLPYDSSRYEISAGFAGLVSSVCLYFMSLSLLLPVYLYNMTEERSQGLVEYVSLMGVGKTFQLMSRWMFDYLIYLLVMVVLLILGLVFQLAFFLKTNPALYILLFLLWGNAQIAMSYFLSSLLTSPKTSAVIGYFMVLVNVGVSVAINMTVMETTIPNQAWMLHPPTAFLRGMLLIASGLFGIRNMQPYNSAEIWIVFAWLLGMSCILYLGAIYFENILPHGGGKTESPFFPLKFIYGPLVKKWKTSSRVSNADQEQTLLDPEESQGEQIAFNVEEDGDCCVERNRIINNRIPENTILVVQNLIDRKSVV